MNLANITTLAATLAALAVTADVTIETTTFTLTVGDDAVARSLVVKATGEETLDQRERIALFSSTQTRPFNNEIKLAHPNKRTTYQANRLRREGDRLVVGFHLAPYEAVVKVVEADGYAVFELVDFISDTVNEKQYGGLVMDVPPVADFRVVQLPVKNRANFGDWLNVSWDDKAAVAVIAAEPFADIDHEVRHGFRILRADLARGRRLRGGKAAIVAGAGEQNFLAAMERCERGLGLPNGVASRRNPLLNASIYWSGAVYPENVDDHIALARRGGFRLMLIFFPAFLEPGGYAILGDYTWNKHYPNGEKDVKAVLDKIRAAGITPGFHTLQTHIGMRSSYVTPVADPRLNLTRHFTLMRDVPEMGAVDALFVSENPVDSVIAGDAQGRCARVLKFGGELFTYEGYATTPPYRFTGVRRGAFKTRTAPHRRGDIGGILDMSEFGATSCYIDQRTDLQDEVAEKIARIYDQGMAFCYFDGSEGVNPPCGVYVPYSQYRVCAKFKKPPIFTEGAAKAHFGWHLQAGANAFDVFSPELFKCKIAEYPLAEAPVMRQDFTRLDFGWWSCVLPGKDTWRGKPSVGTQADQWEYGTSKAAAWDCPATIQIRRDFFQKHPRADDLLEVMRRWEDVRARKWLTPACRERLRDPAREFHLLLNGRGAYELVELTPAPVAGAAAPVSAFVFERSGETYATWWHTSGSATLKLPAAVTLLARIDGEAVPTASENGRVALPADNRRYLKTRLSKADLVAAFAAAEVVQGM